MTSSPSSSSSEKKWAASNGSSPSSTLTPPLSVPARNENACDRKTKESVLPNITGRISPTSTGPKSTRVDAKIGPPLLSLQMYPIDESSRVAVPIPTTPLSPTTAAALPDDQRVAVSRSWAMFCQAFATNAARRAVIRHVLQLFQNVGFYVLSYLPPTTPEEACKSAPLDAELTTKVLRQFLDSFRPTASIVHDVLLIVRYRIDHLSGQTINGLSCRCCL